MKMTTPTSKQEGIARAYRDARIFRHASSKADKRFFRMGIIAWLHDPNPDKLGWKDEMQRLIYQRNDGGFKYKLDRDFEAWAKETIKATYTALCQPQTK